MDMEYNITTLYTQYKTINTYTDLCAWLYKWNVQLKSQCSVIAMKISANIM